MTDREKVIKGLGMCAGTNEDAWETHSTCDLDCPYAGKGCVDNLMADARALLKEKEAVVRCKDCIYGKPTIFGDQTWCCKPKSPLNNSQYPRNNDWYCADGERKEGGEY